MDDVSIKEILRPRAMQVTWLIQSLAINFFLINNILDQNKSVKIQEMINNSIWPNAAANIHWKFSKITHFYQIFLIFIMNI